jgi:hypothetical protein
MPRPLRNILAGEIDHVLNRGNAHRRIFRKPEDYCAFINVIADGLKRYRVDLQTCIRAAGRASRWNRYPRASAAAARRPRADRMGSDPFMTPAIAVCRRRPDIVAIAVGCLRPPKED